MQIIIRKSRMFFRNLKRLPQVSECKLPRAMKLRQKVFTGKCFLWAYSSILSGIRIPQCELCRR